MHFETIYSPSWTLNNGDGSVLDCLVQMLHEIELNVIRFIIREDWERFRCRK